MKEDFTEEELETLAKYGFTEGTGTIRVHENYGMKAMVMKFEPNKNLPKYAIQIFSDDMIVDYNEVWDDLDYLIMNAYKNCAEKMRSYSQLEKAVIDEMSYLRQSHASVSMEDLTAGDSKELES